METVRSYHPLDDGQLSHDDKHKVHRYGTKMQQKYQKYFNHPNKQWQTHNLNLRAQNATYHSILLCMQHNYFITFICIHLSWGYDVMDIDKELWNKVYHKHL